MIDGKCFASDGSYCQGVIGSDREFFLFALVLVKEYPCLTDAKFRILLCISNQEGIHLGFSAAETSYILMSKVDSNKF